MSAWELLQLLENYEKEELDSMSIFAHDQRDEYHSDHKIYIDDEGDLIIDIGL